MSEHGPILITGADGFIGRHLVNYFSEHNRSMVLATRKPATIAGQKSIPLGDIGPATDWSSVLAGCTGVVHLAGRAHVLNETAANPATAFENTNHLATAALAAQAARAGVKRFVFASTIALYHPRHTRLDANTQPNPQNDYGRSKLAAEQALKTACAARAASMTYTILRLPLVYGPHVGARFLQLLKLASLPLPLPFASLNNQRSLLYVRNFAHLVDKALIDPAAGQKTFLVCDGDDVSTPEILRQLAIGMGRRPGLWPFPSSALSFGARAIGKADLWHKFAGTLTLDASPLHQQLEWAPPYSAAEALRQTAVWFARR